MKKRIVLFSLICIMFLSSCSSLMTSIASSSGYTAQVYSSPYQAALDASARVFVICDTTDFMAQRATEAAVTSAFADAGIASVAFSDVARMVDVEDLVDLFTIAMLNECRYLLYISYSDTYTYEYGGGIAELYFDSEVTDLDTADTPLRVSGAAVSSENEFLSYPETIGPACECIGQAIVEEYTQYVVVKDSVLAE